MQARLLPRIRVLTSMAVYGSLHPTELTESPVLHVEQCCGVSFLQTSFAQIFLLDVRILENLNNTHVNKCTYL